MNKKFVALLIPLLLLPMISFAAAHWYDNVTKQYKLKVGTMCVEVTKWHVMRTTSYDVDCDGEVFGDELQITNLWGKNPCDGADKVVGVQILADPIFPCWELQFEMIIHNKGQLTVKLEAPVITWGGPYDLDPCWDPIKDPVPMHPGFQYEWQYYVWIENQGWIPKDPTTFNIKPCESVRVVQYIHFFGQLYPELQCHWFRMDIKLPFTEFVPEPISSYTWTAPPRE